MKRNDTEYLSLGDVIDAPLEKLSLASPPLF